jgi:hypothetical protein
LTAQDVVEDTVTGINVMGFMYIQVGLMAPNTH